MSDLDKTASLSADIAEYLFMRAASFVEDNTKYNGEYKLNAILGLTASMATTFAGITSNSDGLAASTNIAEATRQIQIKTLK